MKLEVTKEQLCTLASGVISILNLEHRDDILSRVRQRWIGKIDPGSINGADARATEELLDNLFQKLYEVQNGQDEKRWFTERKETTM